MWTLHSLDPIVNPKLWHPRYPSEGVSRHHTYDLRAIGPRLQRRASQRSVDHPRIRTFDDVYCRKHITECDNNASEVVAATIMMYNIVIVWSIVIPTTH